jgi:hypothetical protein
MIDSEFLMILKNPPKYVSADNTFFPKTMVSTFHFLKWFDGIQDSLDEFLAPKHHF